MMTRFLIPAVIVLLSLIGAYALIATAPALEPDRPEPVAVAVRVTEVTPGPVQLLVSSQGTVTPSTETELIPEVSGRVEWLSPSLVNGGYFERGDVLLRLETQDYEDALDRAAATLARTEAEQQHAAYEHERMQQLETRQLASRSQFEDALRALRVAQAARKEAQVAFDQAERDLQRTQLRAPFSGLIKREAVDIGQFIGRGNAIATLYATDEVEVRLPIADRQLAFISLPVARGALPPEQQPKVTLRANYAGRALTWNGTVVRTEAEIDSASRMVHVVARVANENSPTPLSVGLFVSAEIEGLAVDDIVVLPRSALRNQNEVMVVDADNRLSFRTIKPLRMYRDELFVQGGLSAGERVCVSPLQTAVDGMRVQPVSG